MNIKKYYPNLFSLAVLCRHPSGKNRKSQKLFLKPAATADRGYMQQPPSSLQISGCTQQ
jgi:hypothetical protein